jgi:mxaJ protein
MRHASAAGVSLRLAVTALAFVWLAAAPSNLGADGRLRVCADPNNLPFTDARGAGFENANARVLARDLGTTVDYTWRPQRRGFLRETLDARACDVVMGLPAHMNGVRTTRPYYRSTYVFVSRAEAALALASLDDPRLRHLRLGIPLVGDDGASTPPGLALAARGLVSNVVGYSAYGDYSTESPPSQLIRGVARREVDVALAWGPLAGYYATRQRERLVVHPIRPGRDDPRMVFDIAVAVRRDDGARAARLQRALDRRRREVDAVLARFGVPRVDAPAPAAAPEPR